MTDRLHIILETNITIIAKYNTELQGGHIKHVKTWSNYRLLRNAV